MSARETASAAPDPMAALATIPKTVVDMAAGFIGDVLAPLSPSGTPPESPTLLGLMAWARQQSAQSLSRQSSTSTVGQTTQVDPPAGDPPPEEPPVDDLLAASQVDEVADAHVDGLADAHVDGLAAAAEVQGLNPDFERTTIVSGLNTPTDFRFLPDGRILIA
ncbi:MAG TPA: hypothetical protein VMS92_06465, partial [Mycobacterium sp.]|nr:hypothetical protein [Mycobacterium sp.]